jgi:hypothetical protein
MAYCRFGPDSDVYVYRLFDGGFQFYISDKNSLGKPGSDFMVLTLSEAMHRMMRLVRQGFKVPEHAMERFRAELEEEEI